jgi:hypothetical protein
MGKARSSCPKLSHLPPQAPESGARSNRLRHAAEIAPKDAIDLQKSRIAAPRMRFCGAVV